MGANVLEFNKFNRGIEKDNVNVACISSSWFVLIRTNLDAVELQAVQGGINMFRIDK